MDMVERQNRTLICSVLFLDIVEYSMKSVADQIKLKDRLNVLLSEVLKDVALNDRVVLDTGDGAAISFLGDPEDALFAALSLRDDAATQAKAPDEPEMLLRIGVNLGPVKLVKDLNGQRNIIGDGINVAQRVMSYCTPGQVLVSRSYFEVVSRMSHEFAQLFQYEGARTDKHVREHEIYAVVAGGAALRRAPDESESHDFGAHESAAVIKHMKRAGVAMKGGLRRHTKRVVALAALLVLGAAIALVVDRNPPSGASAKAQNPALPQPKLAAAEQPAAQPPPATETVPTEPPAPKASAAHPAKQAIVTRPAMLSFAITPWGEIFIDGKTHGASPPVRELHVPPGKHKIEIRNSGYPSHIVEIDAKSGARIEIKYIFH